MSILHARAGALRLAFGACLALALAACGAPEPPTVPAPEVDVAGSGDAAVTALVEGWFDDSLALDPLMATYAGYPEYNDRIANRYSAEHRAAERELRERALARAAAIDRDTLSDGALLSLDVFVHERQLESEGERFPSHLMPLTQFFSIQNAFPSLGTGRGAQPFASVADYEAWISRVEDFAVLMAQAIANMREGMASGVTLPRVLVERMIPQLEANIVEDPEDSLFWQPVASMPEAFDAADRERLTAAYRRMITDTVLPTYVGLRDFLRDEYLPAARTRAGIDALPDGAAWYRHLVRVHTSTDADPDALHQLGLDGVAANLEAMREVMAGTGFEGSLRDWFVHLREDPRYVLDSAEAVLEAYRAIGARMDAAVPRLFDIRPEAPFEIRAIEPYRAASGPGAFYQSPAPDGSRPGVFYVNTHNLAAQPTYGMETLFMHEAIPGHHFQRGLQIEIEDLPRFRRFGGGSAYTEGWALYAESLGRELGFYEDPMQWYGHLGADQLRAMRLVVDTGLHARGWSREQAIDYMLANSSMAESDVVAEVERYMAIPGQALAFKVGQRKIRELRERAAVALGEDFDVRDFHREVLVHGPLPLAVLERRIDAWIEQRGGGS